MFRYLIVTAFIITPSAALAQATEPAPSIAEAAPTLSLTGDALPSGLIGVPYAHDLRASGGAPPYRYAVTTGDLPAGLTLSPTGMLSGSPAVGGRFPFTVTATDSSRDPGPSSTSAAQVLTIGSQWVHKLTLEASPVFGNEIAAPPGDSVIDDAEGRATLSLERTYASGTVLALKAGASVAPNWYDDEQPGSAMYIEAGWRGRQIVKGNNGDIVITPHIAYRFSTTYLGEFETAGDTVHALTTGLKIEDELSEKCVTTSGLAPIRKSDAACEDGWSFAFEPTLRWADSSADSRAVLAPAVEVTLSRPLPGSFKFTGTIRGQGQFYDRVSATGGGSREDWRVDVTAQIDISEALRNAMVRRDSTLDRIWSRSLAIQLGVRFSSNSSNLDGADFNRRYFMPTISWTRRF